MPLSREERKNDVLRIALTGGNGSMGSCVTERLMKQASFSLHLLLTPSAANRRFADRLKKRCGDRVRVLFGDVRNPEDCKNLVRDADILLHMAALIPPASDRDEGAAYAINYEGTVHLTDAILEQGNRTTLLYISSVALYGHRTKDHPYGRVGDPLLVSVFDHYAASKRDAERYILESDLKRFAVLRQTGILFDGLLQKGTGTGLTMHMPWNTPVEWVTANDSARLLYRILRAEQLKKLTGFWNRVYNIGGGLSCRQTGYETYDDGFRLFGADVKSCFLPGWCAVRNFHCLWFSDGDALEDRFHFRRQGVNDFWNAFQKKHRLYAAGKLLPKRVLRSLVIQPMTREADAPLYWLLHLQVARIRAFFGDEKAVRDLPDRWEDLALWHLSPEYARVKQSDEGLLLSHGYDESKKDAELTLQDVRDAAAFRGGRCLSDTMETGDLKTKLLFECHAGHRFSARPYTVLKAGHWCAACQPRGVWQYDLLAKKVPFYAQVWYDSHDPEESFVYTCHDGKETVSEADAYPATDGDQK